MRAIAVTLLALPLLAQHGEQGDAKKRNPAIGNSEAIVAGEKLFVSSCAGCHGPKGDGGRGPNLRSRGVWHPLQDDALFDIIQKGVAGSGMPAANLPDEQIWQLAAFVRSLTAAAFELPAAGDTAAGEAVFWGKGECGKCHRVRGRGGMLGPDLSNVGALRLVEQIREAILDPDADGFAGYRGVTAVLKDGRTIRGVARNRSNYSIQILDETGKLHLLAAGALREVIISPHSPMPRDYKERLSAKELGDLIAFLSRQSMRPYEPPDKKDSAPKD